MWLLLCWKHASAGFGSFFFIIIIWEFSTDLWKNWFATRRDWHVQAKRLRSFSIPLMCASNAANSMLLGWDVWQRSVAQSEDHFRFFLGGKHPIPNGSFLLFPSKYDYFWGVSPSVDAPFSGVSHSLCEPWSRGVSMVSRFAHEAENPDLLGIGIRAKGIGSANFLGNSWRIVFRMEHDSMS